MNARILVAEDDAKQAELLRVYLTHEGYSVSIVHDGRTALEALRRDAPDLLVLDVMMPRVDGLDVCRVLRRESDLPVLMVTARCTEDDLLLGLDLGADDYMSKPYSPRELTARVRTLLRRARPAEGRKAPAEPALVVGGLRIDPARHQVWCDGVLVECTPGEFRLLAALADRPGQVFSREQILGRLHGTGGYFTVRTVDTHVMNLRRKIEDDPARPTRLLTVYGVGYVLSDEA
ncbi:response regulator transcription factor [Streptomyces sp. NPDC091281]|uniref:response regulator transcription factor n=1 Tax=Streptomyces sp. NPDC091281 TaxID=3365985 RepID=UPI0037F968D6